MFDENTDVLTDRGFIPFFDISLNDRVMTLDSKTFSIRYYKPITKQVYYYNGDMYRIRNRSVDMLVTPNHKLFLKSNPQGKYKFINPTNIYTTNYIPNSGIFPGIDKDYIEIGSLKLPAKWFMELVGIFIGDGWVSDKYRFGIRQTPNGHLDPIRNVLSNLPIKWTENSCGFHVYEKELVEYFRLLGKTKDKHIPNELLDLNPYLLSKIWDGLIVTDGYKNGNYERLYTSSELLCDQSRELLLKMGYTSSVHIREPRESNIRGYKFMSPIMYEIYKRNSKTVQIKKAKIHISKYSGMVYDLTIPPNYTLFIRRNNKVSWSGGNCGDSDTTFI